MSKLLTSESSKIFDYKQQERKLKHYVSDFIVPMRDKPKTFGGLIPWCRIEDLEGRYLYGSKSNQMVNELVVKNMNLKVYPINTVICSCSANLGVCAIVKKPLVTNQTFIGLVCKDNLMPEFLYYLMIFKSQYLQAKSSGTTIAYLSRKQFEDLKVLIPPLDVQSTITKILNNIEDEINDLHKMIGLFKQQKKGLMQQLLTGKIRVKVD